MEITYIKIINYRNLNGLEVNINQDINFIVGENNIGKSNFQNCLLKILSGKAFQKDFTDESQRIVVEMTFHLNEEEIGIFDDLVDPMNREMINIISIQENLDEYIKYYHKETGETIPSSLIKRVNIIVLIFIIISSFNHIENSPFHYLNKQRGKISHGIRKKFRFF